MEIKYQNKVRLAKYIKEHNGIDVDPRSIFDIQVKRLHEYKTSAVKYPPCNLSVQPDQDASGNGILSKNIHLRCKSIRRLRNSQEDHQTHQLSSRRSKQRRSINGKIKVVFIENYRVSNAEWIFAAADVSEQISTASKEASGTGNMKFMLNGAVTLGTMDGANVEISELVGKDNIYIFGESSEKVIEHYEKADYCSRDIYENDKHIKECVDFIVSEKMLALGHKENLERLHHELVSKDWFMTLLDFNDYVEKKRSGTG